MKKTDIRNLTYQELIDYFSSIDEASFRADQVVDWIYKKSATTFVDMKNIPKLLQEKLNQDFIFFSSEIIEKDISSDGTMKVLFGLKDGEHIETVFIPTEKRATVCVSTQAGCKFGCKFCASGIGGWKRNLTAAEILDQVLQIKALNKNKELTHIVFMGVGEPLDNYENMMKAIWMLNSHHGLTIGARRITVSTAGLIPQIQRFQQEGIQVGLAISLHGSNDKMRSQLMPINTKYSLKDLIKTCHDYCEETNRKVTFEYILIKDLTCTSQAARELIKLLKGLLCKINLIAYNEVKEFSFRTPAKVEMKEFKDILEKSGIYSTIRMPRGNDVSAACGQLRHQEK